MILHKLICINHNFLFCLLGMVTAGFCILFMKIKVEWHSIIFCSIGAFFGLIFGKSIALKVARIKLFLLSILCFAFLRIVYNQ